jgi:fucose 4-O-acetylase-like acetyltransferase
MEPKRINYTDIAKGIGIILVIFGHTLRGVPGLVNFIYSFHVPLFFVISGFFYSPSKNDNTKLFILKKVKTLLIPFFSFYLLSYLYWFFVEQSFRPSTSTEFYVPLIGLLYGTSYKMFIIPNGALWFLPCFFSTEILAHLIFKHIKSKFQLFILTTTLITGFVYPLFKIVPLPLGISSALTATFFYGISCLLKEKIKGFLSISKLGLFAVCLFFMTIVYFMSTINGRVDLAKMVYNNHLIYIAASLIGAYSILFLSAGISKSKILQWIGQNSLVIFALSEPVKRAVIYIMSKISHISISELRDSVIYSLCVVIIVILIFVPISIIINKWFYFLIGKQQEQQ